MAAREPNLHPATALAFARVGAEYARWHALAEELRSQMPAWWWAPVLAVRGCDEPLPDEVAGQFGVANYAEAARIILASLGGQEHKPWPGEFPAKYRATVEEPAASAEPAAQAEAAAIVPIA